MKHLLALAAILVSSTAWTGARVPVPFGNAGRDGYVFVLWGNQYTDRQLGDMFARIRSSGATHLVIPILGCQTDVHSADVGSCEVADRAFTLKVAGMAIRERFDASFLPIVVTKHWDWRGNFDPVDVDGWFRTYTAWISGVAGDAQKLGMRELVAGTEFVKLYRYEDRWRGVLDALRKVFRGPLILTVNWSDLDHRFWDAADAIGVSAYFPLADAADPDQDTLDQAWEKVRDTLLAISTQWKRPIHVTELGYPSVPDAARTPWTFTTDANADPDLQARCFSAFANAWAGESALARVNVWATSDPADPSRDHGFETLGKPAESVLRQLFSARRRAR